MLTGIHRARGKIAALEKFAIDAATLRMFIEQGLTNDQLKQKMKEESLQYAHRPPLTEMDFARHGTPEPTVVSRGVAPTQVRAPSPGPLNAAQLQHMSTDDVLRHFNSPLAHRPAAPPTPAPVAAPTPSLHVGAPVGPTANTFVGRR